MDRDAKEGGSLGRRIASELGSITFNKVSEVGFENAKLNGVHIARGKNILALHDSPIMEGKSALVLAAGPSLHRTHATEVLQRHKYGGKIVATDSAMSWCLRRGIIPDLVVTLDPHPHRIVRWFGDTELTEEKLKSDDYFARQDMDPNFRQNQLKNNQELVDLVNQYGPRIRIAVSSSASQAVVRRALESGMQIYWWNPLYDDFEKENSLSKRLHEMNGLPCLNAGGNVGSSCWVMAHVILNKKSIGLVGVDFGYYSDTPYAQTQYYKEIVALVGESRLEEVYVRFLNPHLKQEFYTDPAYLWYRDSFLEMLEETDSETHNCSGGGILFGPGIKWTSLEEFIALSGR